MNNRRCTSYPAGVCCGNLVILVILVVLVRKEGEKRKLEALRVGRGEEVGKSYFSLESKT